MTRYVFLYSRQKPWIPASTGRPPGVLQPPASPPTAGEASSKVTWQLVSADSASAAEYPAQPPPMTTISLGRERRSGGCRAAGSDQAIDKSGTCMRRSGSRVLASSRAPQAEPLVHVVVQHLGQASLPKRTLTVPVRWVWVDGCEVRPCDPCGFRAGLCPLGFGWMVVRFVRVIRVPACARVGPACVPCVPSVCVPAPRLPPVSFYRYPVGRKKEKVQYGRRCTPYFHLKSHRSQGVAQRGARTIVISTPWQCRCVRSGVASTSLRRSLGQASGRARIRAASRAAR